MSRRALLRDGMLASGIMLGAPLLAACGQDNKAGPAKAGAIGAGSLRLPWVENVEFAGSYIAGTNGYYKADGFSSFTLIGGGPTATPVETDLVAGKALFGISSPDLAASAVARGGAGIKIIGTQFQKNPFALLSMADNPIRTPRDMIGKKIGVQALNESLWAAFLKANHINPNSITKVPVQFDPLPLTTGVVDGWVAHIKGWKGALAEPALGARLAVEKYGKNLGLNVAEQTLESKTQNTLVLTDDTKKNGLFPITPELIAENIATLKLGGTNVTAEQLFDLSVLTEVYQENPALV